jgi:hypothetical protein
MSFSSSSSEEDYFLPHQGSTQVLAGWWSEIRGLAASWRRRPGNGLPRQGLLDRLCACPCLVVAPSHVDTSNRANISGLSEFETLVMSEFEMPHASNALPGDSEGDGGWTTDFLRAHDDQSGVRETADSAAASKESEAACASVCAAQVRMKDHTNHDAFGEAGKSCSICAAETRMNTHFALPCLHAACSQCWDTWLKERTKCMMCNTEVLHVQRYAESLVPLQAHEVPGTPAAVLYDINAALESAGAAVLESLVSIKSRLVELDAQVEDRQSHLQGSIWRMSPDVRNSVASVEMLAVSEDLELLRLTLLDAGQPSLLLDDPPFVLLHSRVRDLEAVLRRLGDALESYHADQDALPPLRITLGLLRDCAPAVVLAQWKLCSSTLLALLRDRVPDMLAKIQRALGEFDGGDSADSLHGER